MTQLSVNTEGLATAGSKAAMPDGETIVLF